MSSIRVCHAALGRDLTLTSKYHIPSVHRLGVVLIKRPPLYQQHDFLRLLLGAYVNAYGRGVNPAREHGNEPWGRARVHGYVYLSALRHADEGDAYPHVSGCARASKLRADARVRAFQACATPHPRPSEERRLPANH